MNRRRITVPAKQIKRRCICGQCGQEKQDSESDRIIREQDIYAHDDDENHYEHVYPHPDTWEP